MWISGLKSPPSTEADTNRDSLHLQHAVKVMNQSWSYVFFLTFSIVLQVCESCNDSAMTSKDTHLRFKRASVINSRCDFISHYSIIVISNA